MRCVFIVFALLIASRSVHAQAPLTHEAMTERLSACISCHGKEGRTINAEYLPRIAGKPAGYLFNQLMNFRDGRRNNTAMTHLLQPLSDAYLREITEYFPHLNYRICIAGEHTEHAELSVQQSVRARCVACFVL